MAAIKGEFLEVVAQLVRNELPLECTLGKGVKTVIDHVRESNKEEVFGLLSSLAGKADGVSKEQFQTREQMEEFLALGPNVNLCLRDAARSDKVYCFMNMKPSPLCRSNQPVFGSGYVLLHPEYRGKGVYSHVIIFQIFLGASLGYIGGLSRTLSTATGALIASKKGGISQHIGIIPDSLQMNDGSWTDDLIAVSYNHELEPHMIQSIQSVGLEVQKHHAPPGHSLPRLNESEARYIFSLLTDHQRDFKEKFQALPIQYKTGQGIYVNVDAEASLQVEKWIRDAALVGSGFGIDEFDNNGLFNRKFLRHTVTLGAFKKTDNQLVGGLLVGYSSLVRTVGPSTFGGYIVIGEKHRRSGYAFDLLDICEKMAQQFRVRNIISDVLISPRGIPGFHLASRAGYTVTGQLHKCAYLKDVGLTDSLLMYKRLSPSRL